MANKAAKFLKKFLKNAYHLLVFILIASIIIFFGGFEIKADEPGLGAQAAALTGINPSSAYPGDTITLSGTGFGPVQDAGFVEFFDGSAQGIKVYTVTAWNDTSIECVIPQTALSGPVTVTNTSGKSNPLELIILGSGSLPADTTPGTGDTTAPDTGETTPESTTDTTGDGTGVTSETTADSTFTDAQKQLISQDLANPDGNFGELDMVEQSSGFNSKKLIIKYKPDSKALKKLKEKKNTLKNKDKTLADKDITVIEVPDTMDVAAVKEQLQKRSDIELVEADYEVKAFFEPNDTYYNQDQYNMGLIDAVRAWDITNGGSPSVIVAVIDTGAAYEDYGSFKKAADLSSGTFVPGYNFLNDGTHPNDDNGHGTHVIGTIAQTTNNAYGCAGLAYNVKIMPLKILDSAGNGSGSDLIAAIYWAVDNVDYDVKVINISLGGSIPNSLEQQAVQYAKNNNVMVICATGNNNGSILYPAAYSESIAVGSVGASKARSSFSNYGPQIDVVAPGELIYQETINGSGDFNTAFYYYSGTSMATPHVAALAALILSVNPSLTYDQVESNIKNNCEDLGTAGFDNYYGNGLIDVYESLLDLSYQVPVASNAAIVPGLPTIYEDLTIAYDYSDPNLIVQSGTRIRWYKNTQLQAAYNDLNTVPSNALLAGDQWYCTVSPCNGVIYGTTVTTGTVTVYTGPKTLWYLPEGFTDTALGFETFILMMNPSATDPTNVKVSFLKSDGTVVEQTVTIPKNSRSTIKVSEVMVDGTLAMLNSAFGTKVEVTGGGPGIVVERAMYYPNGAHDTMGATAVSNLWYLPEGFTGGGFETFILMMNPSATDPTNVKVSFLKSDGTVVDQAVTIPKNSRYTIKVNDVMVDGTLAMLNSAFGTKVEVTGGGPGIVVERAMYYPNGAHDTMGATAVSNLWYLPEGFTDTALGFETFILMMNPSATDPTNVKVSFLKSDGTVVEQTVTIPKNSRSTIKVSEVMVDGTLAMLNSAFGTKVEVTGGGPGIVVERAMYYPNGAHDTMGATAVSNLWYLPEGFTGGGFETFILMMNPSATDPTNVKVSFLKSDGTVVDQAVTIPKNSRYTIKVNDVMVDGTLAMLNSAFGTKVEVTGGGPGIVVERAMYYSEEAHCTMAFSGQ